MRFTIIILLLFFSTTATAKDSDWAFAFVPIIIPVHTLVHESSHVLGAKIVGQDITSFKPYPHTHDGDFYLGRVSWVSDTFPTKNERMISALAPYVVDMAIFATADVLLSNGAVDIKTFWGITLYLFGIVAPLVDFAKGYSSSRDWQVARQLSRNRTIVVNVLGAVALGVGLYRFVVHTRELLRR